jgi:pimeloyl-ACP methyl ester carboxylesterase
MRRVTGDGVALAVLDEGQGRPMLLLRGFPDSSRVWRYQIPALVDAGMRVIAPDLRGFGESERPAGIDEDRLGRSLADVLAVLDELGIERAHAVGHDWGAGLEYVTASWRYERIEGATHSMRLDAPQLVNDLLLDFLDSHA